MLRRVAEAAKLVAEAHPRLAGALTSAHDAGCSWRRIGGASGIPYQILHRRFREHHGLSLSDVRAWALRRSGSRTYQTRI
jgi:hypothetical protein